MYQKYRSEASRVLSHAIYQFPEDLIKPNPIHSTSFNNGRLLLYMSKFMAHWISQHLVMMKNSAHMASQWSKFKQSAAKANSCFSKGKQTPTEDNMVLLQNLECLHCDSLINLPKAPTSISVCHLDKHITCAGSHRPCRARTTVEPALLQSLPLFWTPLKTGKCLGHLANELKSWAQMRYMLSPASDEIYQTLIHPSQ